MTRFEVICGDVRDLPVQGPFHAILSDPPYELGFMGKSWDSTGVAYDVDMWASLLDLLHPGGFGMAFSGSRTYHRMACAIEDAGAVLHPMIGWVYGSGFPKATRIDTQVDKAAGMVRPNKINGGHMGYGRAAGDISNQNALECDKVIPHVIGRGGLAGNEPQSDLARTWSGHRYGLQALKPAIEPICCFQRPYQGKPWQCITETGAGALWIDGSRIEADPWKRSTSGDVPSGKTGIYGHRDCIEQGASGRWPANFVLSHTPDCNGTCAPNCAVRLLGEQSGESKSSDKPRRNGEFKSVAKGRELPHTTYGHSDTGTAARFFTQVDWQLEQAEPVYYCAKASRRERNAGLEGMALKACGMMEDDNYPIKTGGGNLRETKRHNPHPTVKPIALARHLATLLLPPPEYAPRAILVPYSGVGSEMIGALLAGWEIVVGIEQDLENCDIARVRGAHWIKQPMLEGLQVSA